LQFLKNKQLICFRQIINNDIEDIKIYVTQTYNLTIDNVYKINNVTFNQFKASFQNNYSNNFKQLNTNNSFKFFSLYSISILIGFSIFLYSSWSKSLNDKQYQQLLKYQKNKTNYKTKKIMPNIIEILKYIKLENLTTQKIIYANNKLKLILLHSNKNKLLNFLTLYNNKTTIDKITFLDTNNMYAMELTIVL